MEPMAVFEDAANIIRSLGHFALSDCKRCTCLWRLDGIAKDIFMVLGWSGGEPHKLLLWLCRVHHDHIRHVDRLFSEPRKQSSIGKWLETRSLM